MVRSFGRTMPLLNPSDGSLIRELAEDDAPAVAAKYARARDARGLGRRDDARGVPEAQRGDVDQRIATLQRPRQRDSLVESAICAPVRVRPQVQELPRRRRCCGRCHS